MSRPSPRLLTVKRSERLTPHMQRLVLTGKVADLPADHESANFKLLIPRPGQRGIPLPPYGDSPDKPIVRTYTLRHLDYEHAEVWVDFLLHEAAGPASDWAARAQPGDVIGFAGPGRPKLVDPGADWFFFVGDMSALPAIAANIERLPSRARGYAVLEVIAPGDRQALPSPTGVEVDWLCNPDPEKSSTRLEKAVREKVWLPGSPAVWVAGESGATRAIRAYMKQQLVERHRLYASGYWQIGLTEDRHQVIKRELGAG